jgi:hypothetical protein
VHRAAASIDAERDRARGAEARVRGERLVGRADLEPVDRLQAVTAAEAEAREDGPDADEAHADDASALAHGRDASEPRDLGLVLEDPISNAAGPTCWIAAGSSGGGAAASLRAGEAAATRGALAGARVAGGAAP